MSTNEIVMDTTETKSGSPKDETIIFIYEDQSDDEVKDKNYYFNILHQAALNDDWNTAREIYEKYSNYSGAKILKKSETALHIAVEAENSSFVLNLVDWLSQNDLATTNRAGNTAFCLVAALGKLELAKAMLSKNPELPLIRNHRNRKYPIQMAAESDHKEMVEFLYDSTKHCDHLPRPYFTSMLKALITIGFYDDEKINRLYGAAYKDDWSTASDIYEKHPVYIIARISKEGDTALHIATKADFSMFVLRLVEKMNKEDLAMKNKDGNTAFCLVATSGNLELAKAMLGENLGLTLIRGENKKYPIEMAALSGHKEMVKFLYDSTKQRHFEEDYCTCTFLTLIETAFYDVALDLLNKYPELATDNVTALRILARTLMTSPNLANQNQEGILKKIFDLCSNKFRHKKLLPPALELVERLWKEVKDSNTYWISKVIFVAASEGNIEFLNIMIRDYPDLILKVNKEKYSIFHVAVLNRQKDIFKFIYKVSPGNKNKLLQYKSHENNNILHMAGMLAPPHRLNSISGVTLQLQQELLWFEEVRKIVLPSVAEAINDDGKTPRALFTETHADLKEKGERWMKDTANSCMIVATLIATVVFAAAFTVPGGTKEDTGTPHFVQKVSFIIFVISDAVSLVSSACSILTFLSILTSRYAEEDFRSVLPGKLFVGLSTLFLSIVTMMVVFCTTIFIVFKDGMIWVPIFVSVIASFPVILFTKHQWQLLSDVAHSTFKLRL